MTRRENEHDQHADDGVFTEGWRRVAAGGFVTVQRGKLHCAALLPYVGKDVYCRVPEFGFPSVNCYVDSRNSAAPGNFIGEAMPQTAARAVEIP